MLQTRAHSRWKRAARSAWTGNPTTLLAPPRRKRKQTLVASVLQASASPDAPADALLLAWYGAGNKSLMAAKCFVETVLECYRRGYSVDELEMSLQLKNLQSQPPLLQPLEQDILLSWMLLIMLTAQQLGVGRGSQVDTSPSNSEAANPQEPADPSSSSSSPGAQPPQSAPAAGAAAGPPGPPITQRFTREVAGLLTYVKQTLTLYREQEYTLTRIQSLQAAVAEDGQGRSQFLELMQQYSWLVLITVEVVVALQLPTQVPLTNPHTLQAPSGYTAAFWPELLGSTSSSSEGHPQHPEAPPAAGEGSEAPNQPGPITPVRAAAVRLLVAFIGAALGSPYARQRFVAYAAEAYGDGRPAGELFEQLQEEEYQQTGGLLPVPGPEVLLEINSGLFGRWLSVCYMSMAQLGVVFPAASELQGWAWAGVGDAVEANALARFASQTLQRLQLEQVEPREEQLDEAPVEDPLAARIRSIPEAARELEAASSALSRELQEKGTIKGREVPPMVRVPDEELASTSSGLLVWSQLIQVAEGTYALVEQQQQQEQQGEQG